MRAADAFRICQYRDPKNPRKKCREPLVDRGRHKWCPFHQALIRIEQRSAGNARWQRAWRQRNSRSVLFEVDSPNSVTRICDLLHTKYNIAITDSLRAKIQEGLHAVLPHKSKTPLYTIFYSFFPSRYEVFAFVASGVADKKGGPPTTSIPPTNKLRPAYMACVFSPAESKISDPKWTRFLEQNGIFDKILYDLLLWSLAMGWDGGTKALIVRLGPIIEEEGDEEGIYYLKYLNGRRYRHKLFWYGKPKTQDFNDPSNRLNRLLWYGPNETGGDKGAWTKTIAETTVELNKHNSSDN